MKSVITCEKRSPPTTARPSGWRSSAPVPRPAAIGTAPIAAARVVIMIGRKRSRHALRIASGGDKPSSRCAWSAKSIIMIAFFFTMPISMRIPMVAMIERSMPKSHSAMSAPTAADGRPAKIVIGWM